MRNFLLIMMIGAALFLGGCMYPQSETVKNQVPYKTQIEMVQSAVDQFQKDEGGILPIKTKKATTPIYQKYIVNFSKLSPKYMAEPPENAFEAGGYFQYVLVDVEKNPTVKLLDVRMAQSIQDLKLRLDAFEQQNAYPPFKGRLGNNAFTLDYKKLGLQEAPTVTSPYSHKELYLILDGKGDIYVDYTPDLYQELQKYKGVVRPGEDIRHILVDSYDFVPAYSLAYTIDKEKKIVFLNK